MNKIKSVINYILRRIGHLHQDGNMNNKKSITSVGVQGSYPPRCHQSRSALPLPDTVTDQHFHPHEEKIKLYISFNADFSQYLFKLFSMINSLPNSSFGAIKKNIKKQIETWKNSVQTENKYLYGWIQSFRKIMQQNQGLLCGLKF